MTKRYNQINWMMTKKIELDQFNDEELEVGE
jgi:hypothetical protein